MKKDKILMAIIVVILMLITTTVILIITLRNDNDLKPENVVKEKEEIVEYVKPIQVEVSKIYTIRTWNLIDDCLKKYFENIDNENILKDITDLKSEENIINQCKKIKQSSNKFNYYTEEMYNINTENNNIYWSKGAIMTDSQKYEVYMMIVTTQESQTYRISTISQEDYRNVIDNRYSENLLNNIVIEENENNLLGIALADDTSIINKYFNFFIDNCYADVENAYKLLDKDYREKRFTTIQNFLEYTKEARNNLENFKLSSYTKDDISSTAKYTITDSNESVYILKVNGVMDFSIQLDNYTIETDEFVKKYNDANDETKIRTNIDKFMKMLNNYDYESAYNLLDENYKNNNFKTLDSYKKYLQSNLNITNYYVIDSIISQGNYYIIKLTTKSAATVSATTQVKQIIMALGEGTDFTMSIVL